LNFKTPQTLLIATHNPGKVREIRQFLSSLPIQTVGLEILTNTDPWIETGSTFEENARQKAEYYSQLSSFLTVADDSGLIIDALDGQPGVLSARFVGASATDEDRNREILRLMSEVPEEKRQARFFCCLSLARKGKLLDFYDGVVEGLVAKEPRGEFGFGYDPIFFIPPLGKTMAEITPEEKLTLSHRGFALRKLAEGLRLLLL
jgi:XTP/dITP diphosphohydrolase